MDITLLSGSSPRRHRHSHDTGSPADVRPAGIGWFQAAVHADYTREDYGKNIKADDDPYLLVNMEKALEPTAPTEENPMGTLGGCPVHNGMAAVDPEDPNAGLDPSDPNYMPPTTHQQPTPREKPTQKPP